MLTLDELLKREGIVAAGEFTPDGKLTDYKAKAGMSEEMAKMTAQFCASVTGMFNALASAYTELYKMDWLPQHSWLYKGGDWTVIIVGNRGIFVESEKADLNKLLIDLEVCPVK